MTAGFSKILTLEISGSEAIKLTNFFMQAFPSSMPSSMFMSKTWAPDSTCILAIARASYDYNKENQWTADATIT